MKNALNWQPEDHDAFEQMSDAEASSGAADVMQAALNLAVQSLGVDETVAIFERWKSANALSSDRSRLRAARRSGLPSMGMSWVDIGLVRHEEEASMNLLLLHNQDAATIEFIQAMTFHILTLCVATKREDVADRYLDALHSLHTSPRQAQAVASAGDPIIIGRGAGKIV
jgi:hypothetical protein